jgi:hypothetical protein
LPPELRRSGVSLWQIGAPRSESAFLGEDSRKKAPALQNVSLEPNGTENDFKLQPTKIWDMSLTRIAEEILPLHGRFFIQVHFSAYHF